MLKEFQKLYQDGFSKFERAARKVTMETAELEAVAINGLMSIDNAAYLLLKIHLPQSLI